MTAMLRGLVAATFTPFTAAGDLDRSRVGPVVEHLLGQCLSAVFLGGSTGEGPSLTSAEREEMVEAYLEALAGRLPAIVHVGHNSLRDARSLARHARRSGARAIAMTPPAYYPIQGVEGVLGALEHVAEAAPEIPLFYYHIPRLTAVDVDVQELVERCFERVPSLVGVKYSAPSLDRLQRCIAEHGDRVNFLFGIDEMLLSGLAVGAHGAVGSTYGFLGPRFAAVIEAFQAGRLDDAQRLQDELTRVIHAIIRYPAQPALKTAMALLGVDCGPPRLPLRDLAPAQREQLRATLRELGALPG